MKRREDVNKQNKSLLSHHIIENMATKAFCRNSPHNILPVYKVIDHTPAGAYLYVFVGKTGPLKVLRKFQSLDALSDKDRNEIITAYGKDFEKKLGLDIPGVKRVSFIDSTIYDDDCLDAVRYRIASALSAEWKDVYMWCNRVMIDKEAFWSDVIEEWASDKTLVSGAMVKALLGAVCGVQDISIPDEKLLTSDEAYKVLVHESKAAFVQVPLGFRYIQQQRNIYFPVHPGVGDITHDEKEPLILLSDNTRHIEFYAPYKRIIHVLTKPNATHLPDNLQNMYYPPKLRFVHSDSHWIKRVDEELDAKYKACAKQYKNDCHIGYAQVRNAVGIPFEVSAVSIDRLFNEVQLNASGIMFAKKITKNSGSMIKLVKRLAGIQSMRSDIMTWVKSTVFSKAVLCDGIILKMNLSGEIESKDKITRMATVIILANGTCDVKFHVNSGDVGVGIAELKEYLLRVNSMLKELIVACGISPQSIALFDTKVFDVKASETQTRVIRITVRSALRTSAKIATVKKIESVIASNPLYSGAFSLINGKDPKKMSFIYRRVDDFASDPQINGFIARSINTLKTHELVSEVTRIFGIDKVEATDAVKGWKARYRQDALRMGMQVRKKNASTMQFMQVRLKPSGMGYRMVFEGVTDVVYYKRVIRLLMALFTDATKAGPAKKLSAGTGTKPNVNINANAQQVNDNEDETFVDVDADLLDNLMDAIDLDDLDNDAFLDEEVAPLEPLEEGKTDKPNNNADDDENAPAKSKKGIGAKYSSYFLTELTKADKVLFTVQGKGLEKYARVCQAYSMRQPVVISENEKERIDKLYPGSYKNIINYGSTEEFRKRNYYMCPEVWCPKSRVSMTRDQFEKAGRKCPDMNNGDEPIVFYENEEYWKDKESQTYKDHYVGFLSPKKHQKMLCMPCCYSTRQNEICKSDEGAAADAERGNVRYIKGETAPVDPDRFGLLPKNLSDFFGNKVMGAHDRGTGIMKKNVDAFFRYGVTFRKHSFLHVMSIVLNNEKIKTDQDVINAICNNMSMPLFMSMYQGLLIKKFLSMVDESSILNPVLFAEFKGWFFKNKSYADTFGLAAVTKLCKAMKNFHMSLQFDEHSLRLVKREFMFYMAYKGFINFMKDMNIVKTHEFLLDLFNMKLGWLNNKDYNILIIESDGQGNVYVPCSQLGNIRPLTPFVLVMKSGPYYEPIYHVKMNGNELVVTTRFTLDHYPAIAKLFKVVSTGQICRKVTSGRDRIIAIKNAIISAGDNIESYVIDYDFMTIGVVLSSGIMLPFMKSYPMVIGDNARYTYIDKVLEEANDITEAKARTFVQKVNKGLEGTDDIIVLGETLVNKTGIACGEHAIMPLKPLSADPWLSKLREDVDMMVRFQKNDPRLAMIDMNNLSDAIFKSLWNEVVGFIKRQKLVYQDILFLRNPLNSIPMAYKVAILKESVMSFIEKITSKSNLHRDLNTFHNRICSSIGKMRDCVGQCSWFINPGPDQRVLGGKCKLVTPRNLYDTLLPRVLLNILNVNVPLKQFTIVDRKETDDVLVFTDADIKNGRLQKVFQDTDDIDAWGFKRSDVAISDQEFLAIHIADPVEEIRKTNIALTNEFKTVPVELRDKLKGFEVNIVVDYKPMTLFDHFARIYNVLNNGVQITADKMKARVGERIRADYERDAKACVKRMEYNLSLTDFFKRNKDVDLDQILETYSNGTYYPSDYELSIMAELCQVNVFVYGRKTIRNPDNSWCLGKNPDALYTVFMSQTKRDIQAEKKKSIDVYEFIVKQKQKVLIEPDDVIDPIMKDLLRKKCSRAFA